MRAALGARLVTVAVVALIAVGVGVAARNLGSEFLPKLEEGNLWVRATMPATISLRESNGYVNEMRKIIAQIPEVERVVSQHGRPDDGTDAAGFLQRRVLRADEAAGAVAPRHRQGQTHRGDAAQAPGGLPRVEFNLSQYLQDNVAEAVSGIKGENSFKLFGPDLQKLTETAKRVEKVLSTIPGVEDLAVFKSLGQPTIEIDVDRVRAARYGLTPGDINTTVRTAIGGDSAGDLYDPGSERHYPIVVRLAPQYRTSIEAIANLRIAGQNPGGGPPVQLPLSAVASVQLVSGPAYIYREARSATCR